MISDNGLLVRNDLHYERWGRVQMDDREEKDAVHMYTETF